MKIYGDHLNRNQVVEDISNIVKSCVEMNKPIAFSVEGEWGKGKTWIIDKVANSLIGFKLDEDISDIKCRNNCDYLVIKYNAWEKDYYEEPLIAILITLINQLNKELVLDNIIKGELVALFEMSKEILEKSLRSISKRLIGIDVVDVGKKGFEIFKKAKKAAHIETKADYTDENIEKDIKTVVKTLNVLSKDIPIVFIVDELDRCLPEHAIKTLERLHHIFGKVNSSVTIISMNESQLRTTVEKMFGKNIPFESYLRKFIDFRFSIDEGSADIERLQNKLENFFNLFGSDGDKKLQDDIVTGLCNNMTAREFERICNNADLIHKWVGKDTSSFCCECAVAELLLFAYKLALEKEENRGNVLPIYGNDAKSKLGKYLKDIFKDVPRRTRAKIRGSKELIYYICMKGVLGSTEFENEVFGELSMSVMNIDDYYTEYIRYYKMIK